MISDETIKRIIRTFLYPEEATADTQEIAYLMERWKTQLPAEALKAQAYFNWLKSVLTEESEAQQFSGVLREQIASTQHDIWSHWMTYLFSCCELNPNGSVTIPFIKVDRWRKQLKTTYADLTEKERESDRHQADKILALLNDEPELIPEPPPEPPVIRQGVNIEPFAAPLPKAGINRLDEAIAQLQQQVEALTAKVQALEEFATAAKNLEKQRWIKAFGGNPE